MDKSREDGEYEDGNHSVDEQHPESAWRKAIEAGAGVLRRWCRFASDRFDETDQYWDRRSEAIIAAAIASLRESGADIPEIEGEP